MQLSRTSNVSAALSLATTALLNTTSFAAPVFEVLEDTEFQASNMTYIEENRVKVNETVIAAEKQIDEDESYKLTLIADVMSGPSPNGLPAVNDPGVNHTYTSPSGSVIKPTANKEQTFSFRDTRQALNLEWRKRFSRLVEATNSISFSTEYDYASLGLSSSWIVETEDRLTGITTGAAVNLDRIEPVGGVPKAMAPIEEGTERKVRSKTEYDFLLGFNQVLTRTTWLQANYVLNIKTGYLTDPYKMFAFMDDADLQPVTPNPFYYEKRPDNRLSHIVFFNVIQAVGDHSLRFNYRYFQDDWDIRSHTVEGRFLFNVNARYSVQLKLRRYTQSAAYFYHFYLVDGYASSSDVNERDIVTSPQDFKYVSADYRLGNLESYTLGLKLSRNFQSQDARLDFRLDSIQSSDKENKFELLKAWVVQIAGVLKF